MSTTAAAANTVPIANTLSFLITFVFILFPSILFLILFSFFLLVYILPSFPLSVKQLNFMSDMTKIDLSDNSAALIIPGSSRAHSADQGFKENFSLLTGI